MDYQAGVQKLLQRFDPGSPQHAELLVLQVRLDDNLNKDRIFGSTETRRAERAEIIYALNALALAGLGVSFNDLLLDAKPTPKQDTQPRTLELPDQTSIKKVLQEQFSRNELQSLCFDLGVDWDDLEGATLSIKAISIVGYFQRRARLPELLAAIRRERPGAL